MPFLLGIEFVGSVSPHNTRTHTRTAHTIKNALRLRAHTQRDEERQCRCTKKQATMLQCRCVMSKSNAAHAVRVCGRHCAVTKQNRRMHILSQSVPNCALLLHPRPIEAGHAMTTDCPRQTTNKQACHPYMCSPHQGSVPCVYPSAVIHTARVQLHGCAPACPESKNEMAALQHPAISNHNNTCFVPHCMAAIVQATTHNRLLSQRYSARCCRAGPAFSSPCIDTSEVHGVHVFSLVHHDDWN